MLKRLLLLTLAACAQHVAYEPVRFPAPPDAYSKAVRTLTERGFTVEVKDETAGLASTKWEDEVKMGTDYRYRWTIAVVDGTVSVISQCQSRIKNSGPLSGGPGEWEDCGVQKPGRNEQGQAIADAIKAP